MQFVELEICQITEDLWKTVLELPIRRRTGLPVMPAELLTAVVEIHGAWRGVVALECSERLARTATARLHGIDTAGAKRSDIEDAVRELANITAGNLKAALPAPCSLGLPTISSEPLHDIGTVVSRITFDCGGELLSITLASGRAAR